MLDKPVPPSAFIWTPPAAATAYPPDTQLLAVGSPAPDFTAITPTGSMVRLSDYKGETVILDFWATWCVPCQRSMPHLESVYESVKSQNVAVLGLCVWDQQDAYRKWVAEKSAKYTFTTAFDPAGRSPNSIPSKLYGVSGIPTQYVIDKIGNVAADYAGFDPNDHRLETALIAQGVSVAIPAGAAIASR